MFRRHQSAIGAYARASADNMARVYKFVIATVQQSLSEVPTILKDIETNGEASKYVWGFKPDAVRYADSNKNETYDAALHLWENADNDRDAADMLLTFFAGLPGLGLAKGGFMVQLCFGLSGCLDSHNINRFGLNASRFTAARFKNAKTAATRRKIVQEYHAIVAKCGGCAQLWDDWCDYVAARQPQNYTDGDHVSRVHVEALGLAA